MALDNYANLKASIESWSHREDIKGKVDDFIQICESEMYSNSDVSLRVRSMVSTSAGVTNIVDRFQALPTGFLETRRYDFDMTGSRPTIDYITPDSMVIRDGSGVPSVYTTTSQIEYDVIPDAVYATNLIYYGKLTGLSDAATTNQVLTDSPNIYLYGSLWALNIWAENDENIMKYRQLFLSAIDGANRADASGNIGVATQKRRRSRNP